LVRALAERIGKTFGVAAEEDQLTGAAIALRTEPHGKFFGGEVLSGGVEENDGCGAIRVELLERGGRVAELDGFDGRVMADTLEIVVEKSAEFRAANFAEKQEADFHG